MSSLRPAPTNFTPTLPEDPSLHPVETAQRLHSPFRAQDARREILATGIELLRELDSCGVCLGAISRAEYAGPKTPNLDGLHANTVARFIQADKAYFAATGNYLQIESGRRTVYRQAELYICWRLGQAGCNPADIPGASVHNYGFAIDIRSASEPAVVAALAGNGWERTVWPSEPWHWEATSALGYDAAKQKQAEMKAPGSLARKWQEQWESARTKNDTRNKKVDDFNARLQVWQPEWDRLRADVEQFDRDATAYNQKADQWNQDKNLFNQWVDRYNAEVEALRQLRARIEAMPEGPEKNALIAEYNRRASAALAEKDRLDRAQAELIARKQALDTEYQALQSRNQEIQQRFARLNAEKESLLKLRDEIDRLEVEIKGHLQKARELLDQIASVVGPF